MSHKNLQKLAYMITMGVIVLLLLWIKDAMVDRFYFDFNVQAISITSSLTLVICGFILGSHNVIRRYKQIGKWTIDYIILVMFLILFVFLSIEPFGLPTFIAIRIMKLLQVFPGLLVVASMSSGYLLSLLFNKVPNELTEQ